MAVRSLLARVQRIEAERAPVVSPFVRAYGSFDAFADDCEDGIANGELDRADMTTVLHCLRRWEHDDTWGSWRQRERVWNLGAR